MISMQNSGNYKTSYGTTDPSDYPTTLCVFFSEMWETEGKKNTGCNSEQPMPFYNQCGSEIC